MFRISSRLCCSVYRNILSSEKAGVFLNEVSKRLDQARLGDVGSHGELVGYWEEVTRSAARVAEKKREARQLDEMLAETSDKELVSMAQEEKVTVDEDLSNEMKELAKVIVPTTEVDVLSKCQMEFTSGAGGQEAMLFTGELLEMYRKYTEWRGWRWDPLQLEEVALGGVRSALIAISGQRAYSSLRFEAGVHRVQRIPLTDKSRMHTSTSSISVLPEPEEVSVLVPSDSVKIETMRASGPGGQNVNKRSTAVRMTHKESGIAVHCMDERFQHLNIQIAYKRLAAILMQKQVDALSEKFSSDRKIQVGSKARAEKIRTYNFQHDKITDHRIHWQTGNIAEFMKGADSLHQMISQLGEEHMLERLSYIIDNCVVE